MANWKVMKDGEVINTIVADNAFAHIYAEMNGYTVEEIIPLEPEKTPAELREEAYNTDALINWSNDILTVTQAAQLWQYYAAEGSEKATQLQVLIAEAKAVIRERYPD